MSRTTYSPQANQAHYPFALPDLPYASNALEPHLSAEAFSFHHGKHHQAYVTNGNALLKEKPELQKETLETLTVLAATKPEWGGLFNNLAQVWNHSFYWHSMKPQGGGAPKGALKAKIEQDFGTLDAFAEAFKSAGATQFGSGWVWLVVNQSTLKILKTANAETPITQGHIPLLTADVWEHAYYVDYRNRRPDYLNVFLTSLVNWEFAEENYARAVSK